jgi:integrase
MSPEFVPPQGHTWGITFRRRELPTIALMQCFQCVGGRGEILQARWQDVSVQSRTLIPITKNGHARTIPLSTRAMAILASLKSEADEDEWLIPLTVNTLKMAWKRLTRRAGLNDLHFHDLRHEAVSRFFELGFKCTSRERMDRLVLY